MHTLLRALTGGDRRSIGESNRIVAVVLRRPGLVKVLFEGIESKDPVLRMRCADALEKVTASRPELLVPYKRRFLHRLARIEQAEVRWHVAPMLARLPLSGSEVRRVLDVLSGYTTDRSSIVKTMAMQALADIALRNPQALPQVRRQVEELVVTGTSAMKARGRILLDQLARAGKAGEPGPEVSQDGR